MTNNEVERLLGGYATNSLTEQERKALFDAALEDQELFNALEHEEALRDLLADTEARPQLLRALKQAPPAQRHGSPFWAWGLAGSLAAAAALLFVLLRSPEPQRPAPQEVAKAPAAASPSLTRADTPPAPAIIARMREEAQPVLAVTVVRRDSVLNPGDILQPGDPVQFRLRAPYSGTLTLTRPDGSESSITVAAGQQYTLPGTPLVIDAPSTFHLTLSGPNAPIHQATITLLPGKSF